LYYLTEREKEKEKEKEKKISLIRFPASGRFLFIDYRATIVT